MLLEWVVPPECPVEQDVVTHVTSLAGETLTAQPLHVWAHVESADGSRYRLELRVGNEDDPPRVLESDDCRKLAEATAFIVALDLQTRAEAAPPPRRPKRKAPRPPPPPRVHGGLGADLFGDLGTMPSLAWGGSVFGVVGYRAVRGELGASLFPRNRATFDSPAGAGASVFLRTAFARGCVRLFVDACLRVEAGTVRGAGFGVARASTPEGVWLAAFAGLTARPFDLGPMRVRTTLEVGTPIRYLEVTIEGIGQVYTPSPLLFRFGVGLESALF